MAYLMSSRIFLGRRWFSRISELFPVNDQYPGQRRLCPCQGEISLSGQISSRWWNVTKGLFTCAGGAGTEQQTLEGIAQNMLEQKYKRVVVMAGAGISTPSGIPDFRSLYCDKRPRSITINRVHVKGNHVSLHSIFPFTLDEPDLMSGVIPKCLTCKGVVKPDIIFFGEELPPHFYMYLRDFPLADLLIIMGTSLEVEPFASLAGAVRSSVPRLLINRDLVGPFALRNRRPCDVVLLGDVVSGIQTLVNALGWTQEVDALMAAAADKSATKKNEE
ncbi:NAD-dependent protein deacetylase sirtuin-3, mitochondrial isoform X2 [Syngnathoides biaculeatus]|uniref:NAD-dependent protein deacetylase sirtuin-3, mitochondrial isoform X2 n=1 Tax=Syngnathoides biaculeatus TaxID=300417 RepID=UPI002ADE6805|nr:NAD-dependent protein deacetylase sirtuin-3, mitochondrial isoform X2 [Syngnathoides biaculeatus]